MGVVECTEVYGVYGVFLQYLVIDKVEPQLTLVYFNYPQLFDGN